MRRRRDTADQLLLAGRFVASGCLDRLCWQSLCFHIFLTCRDSLVLAGSWFWHFLAFLAPGAVLWRDREASESASRKAAEGVMTKMYTSLSIPCSTLIFTPPESMTEVMTRNVYLPKHSMLVPHFHTT